MLGLGFGQIIVGPLSDKYGRKLPLLLSLWLFIFSTIACICSWSIGAFIFFRFLQGIAGAGGIVISRSVATDCYGGKGSFRRKQSKSNRTPKNSRKTKIPNQLVNFNITPPPTGANIGANPFTAEIIAKAFANSLPP